MARNREMLLILALFFMINRHLEANKKGSIISLEYRQLGLDRKGVTYEDASVPWLHTTHRSHVPVRNVYVCVCLHPDPTARSRNGQFLRFASLEGGIMCAYLFAS